MRDVRETSVEIGAVAGRPAQHLARFSEPALRDYLTRYTSPTRSAVPWRHSELTGELTLIHSPAVVDLVGRVPGAPPEIADGLPGHDVLSRSGSCMPPVAPGRVPRVEVTGHPASSPGAAPHAGSLKPTCRDRHPDAPHRPEAVGRADPAPRRRTCSGKKRQSSGKDRAREPAMALSP